MPQYPLRGIVLRRAKADGWELDQQDPIWELVVYFDADPPNDQTSFRSLNLVSLFDGAQRKLGHPHRRARTRQSKNHHHAVRRTMPQYPLRGIVLRRAKADGDQQNPIWELVVYFDADPPNDQTSFRSLNLVSLFEGAQSYCAAELSRERQRLGLEPEQLDLDTDAEEPGS